MTRKNHTPAVVVLVVLVFASLVLGGAIPEQTPTILWSFNSSSTYQQPNSISLRSNDAVVLSTYQWTSSGSFMNSAVTRVSPSGSVLFNVTGYNYYKVANGGYNDTSSTVVWVSSGTTSTATSLVLYINNSQLGYVYNVYTNAGLNGDSFDLSLSPDGKFFTLVYISTTYETRARSYWINGTLISDVTLAPIGFSLKVIARTSQARNPSTGATVYYASAIAGKLLFTWNPVIANPAISTRPLPDCAYNPSNSLVLTDRYVAIGCRGVYVWRLAFSGENRTADINYVLPLPGNATVDLSSYVYGLQIRNNVLFVSWSNSNTVAAFNIAASTAPPKKKQQFARGIEPLTAKLVPQPPLLWLTNLTDAFPPLMYGSPSLGKLDVTPDGNYLAVMRRASTSDVLVLSAASGQPILYTTFPRYYYDGVQANYINKQLHLLISRSSDCCFPVVLLMFSYSSSQLTPPTDDAAAASISDDLEPAHQQQQQQQPDTEHHVVSAPQEIPPPNTIIDALALMHKHQPRALEAISTNKTQWATRFMTSGGVYDMTYSSDAAHSSVIFSTQTAAPGSGKVGNCSVAELSSDSGALQRMYTEAKMTSAQLAVSRMSTTVASVFFNYNQRSCTVYIGTSLLGEFSNCVQSCCYGHSAALSPDGATLALVTSVNGTTSVQFFDVASHKPLHESPASFEALPSDHLQWFTQGSTGSSYLLVETYTGVWIIDPEAGAVVTVFAAPDCTQLARSTITLLPVASQMPDGRVLLQCGSVYLFDLNNITSPQLVAYVVPPNGYSAWQAIPFGSSGIIIVWSNSVRAWSFVLSAYSFSKLRQVPRPTNQTVEVLGSHLWSSTLESNTYVNSLAISPDSQYLVLNLSPAKGRYNLAVIPVLGDGSIVEVAYTGGTNTRLSPVITRYRRDGRLEAAVSEFNSYGTMFGVLFDASR